MIHEDPKGWREGLGGLLEAERGNVTAPEKADDRVWQKLALAIATATPAVALGPSARPRSAFASKAGALGIYALGVVTGVVCTTVVMSASRSPRMTPQAASAESVTVDREVSPVAAAPALTAVADAARESVRLLPKEKAAATPESTLEGERVLLDGARVALGRGDGAQAISIADAHAKRYPHGILAEEREAIAIQALLLVTRYDEARRREKEFEQEYPHSMLLQAVRASVLSIP
jgi:hypothetical protein